MFYILFPGNIRYMNKAIYSFLDTDEKPKVRDIPYDTLDDTALGVFMFERFPWILGCLLQSQRDTLYLRIDIQNHDFHNITHRQDLGRMLNLSRPEHFCYMYKTLHTRLQLHKDAVIREVYYFALNHRSYDIFFFNHLPGV